MGANNLDPIGHQNFLWVRQHDKKDQTSEF